MHSEWQSCELLNYSRNPPRIYLQLITHLSDRRTTKCNTFKGSNFQRVRNNKANRRHPNKIKTLN